MTWDLVLATVTLLTVLLSIILLVLISRIWQGQTPPKLNRSKARTLPYVAIG